MSVNYIKIGLLTLTLFVTHPPCAQAGQKLSTVKMMTSGEVPSSSYNARNVFDGDLLAYHDTNNAAQQSVIVTGDGNNRYTVEIAPLLQRAITSWNTRLMRGGIDPTFFEIVLTNESSWENGPHRMNVVISASTNASEASTSQPLGSVVTKLSPNGRVGDSRSLLRLLSPMNLPYWTQMRGYFDTSQTGQQIAEASVYLTILHEIGHALGFEHPYEPGQRDYLVSSRAPTAIYRCWFGSAVPPIMTPALVVYFRRLALTLGRGITIDDITITEPEMDVLVGILQADASVIQVSENQQLDSENQCTRSVEYVTASIMAIIFGGMN